MKSKVFNTGLALVLIVLVSSFAWINQDGSRKGKKERISTEELIKKFDKNKDGTIAIEEARTAEEGHLYRRFGHADINKDGILTREELDARGSRMKTPNEIIERFDSDSNGTISIEEARKAKDDFLYKGFGMIDANRDGLLEKTEIESHHDRMFRGHVPGKGRGSGKR